MSLAATLIGGMVFGLALAAPPGPMNAVIATESVLRGWGAGFRAGLGAMVADVCFFLLALVGLVTFVQRSPDVRTALFVAGDRKSTRLNSSHVQPSRMPSSA